MDIVCAKFAFYGGVLEVWKRRWHQAMQIIVDAILQYKLSPELQLLLTGSYNGLNPAEV